MYENKRKYTRFSAMTAPFGCVIEGGDRPSLYVNNVSCEGLGVFTYKKLNENDSIDIEMMFPGDDIPLHVKGVVNWVSEKGSGDRDRVYNAGIKLTDMNEHDRKRLIRYLHVSFII